MSSRGGRGGRGGKRRGGKGGSGGSVGRKAGKSAAAARGGLGRGGAAPGTSTRGGMAVAPGKGYGFGNAPKSNYVPKTCEELGIPNGTTQALVCSSCQDKFLQERRVEKVVTKEKVKQMQVVKEVYHRDVVQGQYTQLTTGGARQTAENAETKRVSLERFKNKMVTKIVEKVEEKEFPGFAFCMKCFPQTAKEMPQDPDWNNNAYLCKKCGQGGVDRRWDCAICSIKTGHLAGTCTISICKRHSEPQRCFRCGE